MKTKISIIFLAFFSLNFLYPLYSRAQQINTINEKLTERPWLDKETKILYRHAITQIFGERPSKYRHMMQGPITSIAYKSLDRVLHELDSLAGAEGWKDQKLQEEKQKYITRAPGGILELFIIRYDESKANFKWFFIIIRNEQDEKVTEIKLDYKAPSLYGGIRWWNYTTIKIDKKVEEPFYIYVNEELTSHLSDFKFRVESINDLK